MANDIQKMKPSACCRTLNSTPLGTVINERPLHRYRYHTEVGIRIGYGTHVDLLKFTAWLIEEHHAPEPPEVVADGKRRHSSVLSQGGGTTVR